VCSSDLSGEMMDGFTCYSNIFHNEGDNQFSALFEVQDSSSQNVKVFNNAFITEDINNDVDFRANGYITHSFKNNITLRQVVGDPSDFLLRLSADAAAVVDLENNLYFNNGSATVAEVGVTSYATLALLKAAFPALEAGSIEADPLLVDVDNYNYILGRGSPAEDAGLDLSSDVPVDFYGNPLTAPLNIGPLLEVITMADELKNDVNALQGGSNFVGTNYIAGDVIRVTNERTDSTSPTPLVRQSTFDVTVTSDFNLTDFNTTDFN